MIEITKSRFRWLLTINIITIVVAILAFGLTLSHLPEPLAAYIEATRQAEFTTLDIIYLLLAVPLGILWIVIIVGLYRFKPFAPRWNLGLYLVSLVVFAFDEPTVETALSSTLFQLTVLLDGVIIALTFFSPAALWFQRDQPAAISAPASLIEE